MFSLLIRCFILNGIYCIIRVKSITGRKLLLERQKKKSSLEILHKICTILFETRLI